MDYETLETIMRAPETLYAGIAFAGAVVGFYVSKLFYKNNLRHAEIRRDETLATEERRKLEIQLEGAKLTDAENRHKRRLDLLDVRRKYRVEDKDRERSRMLEDEEKKHQRILEIARELEPALKEYADYLKTGTPDLAEKRAEYSKELIRKFMDSVEENYSEGIANCDNITPEDMENLKGLVEVAYPSKDPRVPPQLERFIDLLNQE
jgi:hypothetical protein